MGIPVVLYIKIHVYLYFQVITVCLYVHRVSYYIGKNYKVHEQCASTYYGHVIPYTKELIIYRPKFFPVDILYAYREYNIILIYATAALFFYIYLYNTPFWVDWNFGHLQHQYIIINIMWTTRASIMVRRRRLTKRIYVYLYIYNTLYTAAAIIP